MEPEDFCRIVKKKRGQILRVRGKKSNWQKVGRAEIWEALEKLASEKMEAGENLGENWAR